MPFALSNLRTWVGGSRAALEVQEGGRGDVVEEFPSESAVWIMGDSFSRGSLDFSAFTGRARAARDLLIRSTRVPVHAFTCVVTPEAFVRIVRGLIGDFTANTSTLTLNAGKRVTWAYRDRRGVDAEAVGGAIYTLEDAVVTRMDLMNELAVGGKGDLVAAVELYGEVDRVEDIPVEPDEEPVPDMPDSVLVQQMERSWRARSIRVIRDPGGDDELELVPSFFGVSIFRAHIPVYSGARGPEDPAAPSRLVQVGPASIGATIIGRPYDEYDSLRLDAERDRRYDYRVTWRNGPRVLTLHLDDVAFVDQTQRVAGGGRLGDMVLEGTSSGIRIVKEGF